jgi:alkanesulfonate monooxygenase SsuD/methylene tetrahydromethanopterin reductase-like flavin-dependent oxidoreductase (luciferase family)
MPSEKVMLQNFFDQVRVADELGYETAWVAETHLSCQVQKRNPGAVIPHFTGEIGLNTDILQLAHKVFAQTKRIQIGSAIRNILCNGGPMAHAEAIRTFLSLHGLDEREERTINIGFASGRFPFSNTPYGIRPRNEFEQAAWPVLRGLIFQEATEVFLRFLNGEIFSSRDVAPKVLTPDKFRSGQDWEKVLSLAKSNLGAATVAASDRIEIPSWWQFDDVGVIPFDAPMHLLRLTIGAHDAPAQIWANRFMPCGVFNLSITPGAVIEETHKLMQIHFNPAGGEWSRAHMPRTVLVFIDATPGLSREARRAKAQTAAQSALSTYWKALEGTIDPAKIAAATDNALVGAPEDLIEQMHERFSPEDRLMLWFDFNNHDNQDVQNKMRDFMENVVPAFAGGPA